MATVVECDADEVLGVNARDQLAAAEAIWQRARPAGAYGDGVTMIAPETVWLSFDTKIAADVVIEPNVVFGLGVTVEEGAEIQASAISQAPLSAKERGSDPFRGSGRAPGSDPTCTSAISSRLRT